MDTRATCLQRSLAAGISCLLGISLSLLGSACIAHAAKFHYLEYTEKSLFDDTLQKKLALQLEGEIKPGDAARALSA